MQAMGRVTHLTHARCLSIARSNRGVMQERAPRSGRGPVSSVTPAARLGVRARGVTEGCWNFELCCPLPAAATALLLERGST